MPIYYPDQLEHNNPNLKLLDDKWINYEVETVSRTIYISNAGSDTTGDGTITTPYATFTKALSTIKNIIGSGVTITLYAVAGTYDLTADDLNTISQFSGSGTLTIQGELALVDSGFTMGAAEVNDPLTYAVSGGNTASWTTNQWKYYFLKSGTIYTPITSNTNTTISVVSAISSTEIYSPISVINILFPVAESTFIHYIGIEFNSMSLKVNQNFNLNSISTFIIRYSKLEKVSSGVLTVRSSARVGFTGNVISNIRLQIHSAPINFIRNFIYGNVNHGLLVCFSPFSLNTFNNTVLENINTSINACCVYIAQTSSITETADTLRYLKFVNSNVAILFNIDNGFKYVLQNPKIIIKNTNYFIRKVSTSGDTIAVNIEFVYLNILGTPTVRWFFDPMYEFVNPITGRNIQITGLIYPEYEANQKYTWNNNTSGNVVVGTTAQNYAIEIDYVIARGTLRETGKLKLTNAADTLIDRVQEFDDCGITFGKNISGTDIQLTYTVDASGNDAALTFTQVKRVMITPLTI